MKNRHVPNFRVLLRKLVSGLLSASMVLSGWPLGWLGERNPLNTPQAEAASGDVILLWDGGAIPSGWTCISCTGGDPFYQLFPRAAATYGGTGGADTHTHPLTLVSHTAGASGFCSYIAGSSVPRDDHTHTWNGTSGSSDLRPAFQNLKVIKATSPSTLPAGAIGMFDVASTGNLPTNWTNYTAMNGKYLRADTNTNTGGAATHTHAISVTSGGPTNALNPNSGGVSFPTSTHTHTVSGTSGSANNAPPYIELVFAKLGVDGPIPSGLIAMFDATLPSGWTLVSTGGSSYENKLLKGNTTFGATGGSATHTHANFTATSTAQSAMTGGLYTNSGGSSCASDPTSHTHDATHSFDTPSSFPAYRDVMLGKLVNLAPSFDTIADSPDPVATGGTTTFTTTSSDADAGGQVKLFVCKANDATSSGCGAGGTWCSATLTGSNPTCAYVAQAADVGTKTYYAFVYDNNNLASVSNPRVSLFTVKHPVSGNAYADEASTVWAGCDGSTQNVSLLVNGAGAQTTTCNASTGAYTFTGNAASANAPVSVFFNTTNKGVAVTVAAGNAPITLNPRKNIVWLTTSSAWYSSSWSYRQKITVQASKVPNTNQTNFPVYVNLSNMASGFFTHVNTTDGRDIRVTTSDGTTEVPREVVYITGSAGELWFKAPTLTTGSNTDFYIYYGNGSATEPAANATYGSQNVWTNSYNNVYHMGSATVLSANDSTAQAKNLTAASAALTTTGKVGGGVTMDGSANGKMTGNVTSVGGDLTLEYWVNLTSPSTPPNKRFIDLAQAGATGINMDFYDQSGICFDNSGGPTVATCSAINSIVGSTWYHFAVTRSGTTYTLYMSGVSQGTSGGTAPTYTQLFLGAWQPLTNPQAGKMDEVRISTTARSANWLTTEYNNQSCPVTGGCGTGFYTTGGEEFVQTMTNTNLNHCDSDGPAACANVPYSVSGTALTVENTVELHVESGKTFAPGGTVTTSPGGAGGDVHIVGTMTVGTNAVSVGGSWNNVGTFTKSSGQTTTFAATATGKTITPGGSNFDAVTFNGAGGAWTAQGNMIADGTATVTNGTFEVGTVSVTAANVTVNGGTLSMTGSGGALKISGSGALSMSSGTWTTLQVAVAPQLTTSNTATPTYVGVNLTGGTLDVGQLSTSYLKNTGFVIGSGVTIGRFDSVTWSSTNQTTAGTTDTMLDITSNSGTFGGHVFPDSWSGGEYNVRLTTGGLVKMLGAGGNFKGVANDCDSQNSCAAGIGVIKWLVATTVKKIILQKIQVNQ